MSASRPITVKFMTTGRGSDKTSVFVRQLPGGQPTWGHCRFEFDPNAESYDWLVAYDDLATVGDERFSRRVERLACAPQHTLFVTMEPSSVKIYGSDFLNQFGHILTSQEPWAIPQPQAIYSQPALRWFYGAAKENLRTFDQMQASIPLEKTATVSTVCSAKQQRHTLHRMRSEFTQELKTHLPELQIFGHGVQFIADKADALDPFRYHVAVENHVAPHHWTEKLADAFLGVTLPFYFGCPNAGDYFPPESFIPIDIRDPLKASRIIRRAIRDNEFEKRLPFILQARQLVLEKYNLFATLSQTVETHFDPARPLVPGTKLYSRHALRHSHPLTGLRYALERWNKRRIGSRQVATFQKRLAA